MMTDVLISTKNYFINRIKVEKTYGIEIFLSFMESTLAGIYYFFSIYFVTVLHFNLSETGLLMSCYGLGTILGGLVGGKVSDHIHPKIVTTIALFFQSAAFIAIIQFEAAWLIALNLFVLGMATYSFMTSNYLSILNRCQNEQERLRAINRLSVASNLGLALSAIVVAECMHFGLSTLLYGTGFLLFLLALFQACYGMKTIGNSIEKKHEMTANTEQANLFKIDITVIGAVIACLFFTGMVISQLGATYPIYLQDKFPEWGIRSVSILFVVNSILVVMFQNSLVDKFKDHNKMAMIGAGAFFIGLGMCLLNFSVVFLIAVFSCIIYTFGEIIFFAIIQLFFYEQGHDLRKGSSLGVYRAVYAASRCAGPAVGGGIYHYFSPSVLWYLCGIGASLFFMLCYGYRKYG